ncbi:sulfur carrier protein ThiS adenylyltransferase ThiF [Frisingicoccus caecimuris]|uniref:Sulfur carrier protein ThiS adenylyltransferase n=1 Tax=Frisingicoccus caecimuris TaxID=1796636 RepID=A0A4R2LA64_9FIRM|nr:sulfur carrier protein ThiS adenylyltransferase ThiF [Frisingicoccus caecimuris]MCR1919021.1 sulfur carrier protein ThiS adenylyltransferase ThiF [Frisingicoccus caecimuris]TCO84798.1 sulfur carrier protein ThiS adenylyltransferase [Frisingicoccus caecimuris]
MITKKDYDAMLIERHGQQVFDTLAKAHVGIAGLGGLGSNIAMMLARSGVGHLLLIDFDRVEPSNLNRQHYMVSHLGIPKSEALKDLILQANPFIHLDTRCMRITGENAPKLFKDCDLVCEAFDKPEAKAELVNSLLENCPGLPILSGSGMAGYGSSNTIRTEKVMKNLYLCGDRVSDIESVGTLMAPRVQICAAHEANMALRLLLGITEV